MLLLLAALGVCSEVKTTSRQPSVSSSVEVDDGTGKRILILHPMYAASHVLTLRALARSLVARGHQVSCRSLDCERATTTMYLATR